MKIFITFCIIVFGSVEIFAQTTTADSLVIDVSNASLNQDAPSVSINRKNKNVIVIGASSDNTDMDLNGISAYTSTDTGKTWSLFRLPLPTDQLYINGQVSVTCDNAGNFYYAYVTNDFADPLGNSDSAGSIVVVTSTDGKTWKNSTPINNNVAPDYYGAPFAPFLSVDNSLTSPHNGRVYAIWYQYYSVDSLFLKIGAYLAWSDNKCVTWTKPKFLGLSDGYQMVRTGKNGEIFIALSDTLGLGDQLFVSNDGGVTFTTPFSQVFTSYPFFTSGFLTGYTGLKGNQGFAAFPYPSFDVDLNSNRIHAIFADYSTGNNYATLEYTFSDNLGVNWNPREFIGINSQDSADRFDSWVSVDQTTGDAYVLYYSSESDPKNIFVAPYRLRLSAALPDLPQLLSPSFNPLIVEKTSSTPAYIGDHTSSDAFGGVYVGSWTQNHANLIDGDIFAFVSISAAKNSVETPIVIHSQKSWLSPVYPNPSQGKSISFSYYLPHAMHVDLGLYDESGRRVKQLADKMVEEGSFTEEFDPGNISSGTYIIRMISDDGQLSQKFIVTRH